MSSTLESESLQSPPLAPRALPQSTQRAGLGFAATILTSAFLLFEVQPLLSKFILPWFGGSPAVWTTAMLFFQVMLFAGYTYAHLLTRLFTPRWQMIVHSSLLLAAACLLPITPDAAWKPTDGGEPTWRILALLVVCVGLPYLVLASTGPLVQAWYSRVYPQLSPYRLYALSNVGSLVALLSYPFYFERALDTTGQAWWWSAGFVAFALLCAACAWRQSKVAAGRGDDTLAPLGPAPSRGRRFAWLALPACGSIALLATTNHVCQDVAVIPFLWVVPLALYLVTFIIAFDHERWYHRRLTAGLGAAALLLSATMAVLPIYINFVGELVIYFAALFLLCMMCHGELVRLKPDARRLTSFYLAIAGGGALGGILVSLVAPMVFADFWEWPLVLATGWVLAIALLFATTRRESLSGKISHWPKPGQAAVAGLLVLAGVGLIGWIQWDTTPAVTMMRNFYGVVTVYERRADKPTHDIAFFSGNIMHGAQMVDPAKRDLPLTYYTPPTGIARTLEYLHDTRGKIRVGVVGLGIGTVAAFAKDGDSFLFYEINPNVVMLAEKYFTYMSQGGEAVEDVVLGDARISLERQSPAHFDVLMLDAFSGDAIPVHLLTSEAFEIYDRHLESSGATMVVNITNHYLDAGPVVAGLARKFGFRAARIQTDGDYENDVCRTDFIVLSRDAQLIDTLQSAPGSVTVSDREIVWTDADSNLFEILK